MLRSITDWINITNSNPEDEWKAWEDWQKRQPLSHYEKSDIYNHYINSRPLFTIPDQSCVTSFDKIYYEYCFGEFTAFILSPKSQGQNIMNYFKLLLDLYDTCKGFSRRLTGDPNSIAILRESVKENNLTILNNHNYSPYEYDYTILHAHTVAQYSLSTLIMRLVSHGLRVISMRTSFPEICVNKCKYAYSLRIFGTPKDESVDHIARNNHNQNYNNNRNIISAPIDINNNNNNNKNEPCGYSWPIDPNMELKCKQCGRITERRYGKHDSCLDCYSRRVCTVCGSKAIVMIKCFNQSYPRCELHRYKQP